MSYDVIVIGGSFAGLSAALQLAGSRRRVLVMDSGEPRNRSAKFSHGFFGHDGQTPSALLVKARSQLLSYSTVSFVDDMATHSAKAGEEFVVTAATGIVRTASRLILATGVRDNLSTIPGLQERWGESMLHCFYCHGYEVAGRRLGVLATSDRSFQTAMLLPDWSDHVTLFTNGVLTLSSEQLADLRTRGVSVETAPVVALLGVPGQAGHWVERIMLARWAVENAERTGREGEHVVVVVDHRVGALGVDRAGCDDRRGGVLGRIALQPEEVLQPLMLGLGGVTGRRSRGGQAEHGQREHRDYREHAADMSRHRVPSKAETDDLDGPQPASPTPRCHGYLTATIDRL